MIGFITTARHARELAAKDVHIHQLDRTAEAFRKERDRLRVLLMKAYVHGPKGRFQRAEAELDHG